MLPSNKRLSRQGFEEITKSPNTKTVFNQLGTLKYREAKTQQASVVISSKAEKIAVHRNKLRRRIYTIFRNFFKDYSDNKQYILYTSKQATKLSYKDTKDFLYELLKKTTK